MTKKFKVSLFSGFMVLTLLMSAFMVTPATATDSYPLDSGDPIITDALDYLSEIQAANGSIGSYSDSAWAVMAIAAAGEDPHDWGDPSVLDYLRDNTAQIGSSWNPPADLGRVILAITAALEDPYSFGESDSTAVPDGDYVAALLSHHDGGQFGADDTLNEDSWAVMALIAAGMKPGSPVIQSTVAFIEENQGEDGGWSWATPDNSWYGGSDVDDTAAAIMALVAAGGPDDPQILEDALSYLHDEQQPSGAFPSWGVENAGSTAWAIDAIVAAGQDPASADWTAAAGNPISFLLTLQEEEGSFVYADPLPDGYLPMREKMTADAVVALLGKPYPVVVPLTFSDPVRGSKLAVNIDGKSFLFTAPDGYNSGVMKAKFMKLKWRRLTILYRDSDTRFICRADIRRDRCLGILFNKDSHRRYFIFDPRGLE